MERFEANDVILFHPDEREHSKKNERNKARALTKFKPDVILFELSKLPNDWFDVFNKQLPLDKNKKLIAQWRKGQIENMNTDIISSSVETLWNENHQVFLFKIDATVELTSYVNLYCNNEQYLEYVVLNYLRDKYMAESIIKKKDFLRNKKVLVLCHNWHWNNIMFLLKNPTKEQIWQHYFVDYAKEFQIVLESKKQLLKLLEEKASLLISHFQYFE